MYIFILGDCWTGQEGKEQPDLDWGHGWRHFHHQAWLNNFGHILNHVFQSLFITHDPFFIDHLQQWRCVRFPVRNSNHQPTAIGNSRDAWRFWETCCQERPGGIPLFLHQSQSFAFQVVIRPMMYIALTYDHRLVDGREAVTFLRTIKNAVEDPRIMLMDL